MGTALRDSRPQLYKCSCITAKTSPSRRRDTNLFVKLSRYEERCRPFWHAEGLQWWQKLRQTTQILKTGRCADPQDLLNILLSMLQPLSHLANPLARRPKACKSPFNHSSDVPTWFSLFCGPSSPQPAPLTQNWLHHTGQTTEGNWSLSESSY